jgi:hypothetical protein
VLCSNECADENISRTARRRAVSSEATTAEVDVDGSGVPIEVLAYALDGLGLMWIQSSTRGSSRTGRDISELKTSALLFLPFRGTLLLQRLRRLLLRFLLPVHTLAHSSLLSDGKHFLMDARPSGVGVAARFVSMKLSVLAVHAAHKLPQRDTPILEEFVVQ